MLSQFIKNSAWLPRVIYLPQIFGVMLGAMLLINSCSTPSEPISISLPDKIDFNFHVRPILSDRCYKCHGPDENARKANLRLDLEKEAFALIDSAENLSLIHI